jgi:hypothetical protein
MRLSLATRGLMRGRRSGRGGLRRGRGSRNLLLGSDDGDFGNGSCHNCGRLDGLGGWNYNHRLGGGLWGFRRHNHNRGCDRRLDGNGVFNSVGRCFVRNRSRWGLNHHGHHWRRDGDCRSRRGRGSLGHHRTGGRARGNRGCRGRHNNNGRRRAGLGNDLARLWLGWSRRRWLRDGDNPGSSYRRGCRGRGRRMVGPRRCFLLLLLGQYGLQHVSGLGDVRQVNLGCDDLRGAR